VPEIETQIALSEAQAAAVIAALMIDLEAWERRTISWHAGQFASSVEAGTGIDIELLMRGEGIRDAMRAFLAENVNLISSVSEETKTRIAGIVWRGYLARTPRRE